MKVLCNIIYILNRPLIQIHMYTTEIQEAMNLVFGNTFQSAHICLIDALMTAYTAEMISIEKVVTSVKRFSNFSASKQLPFDLEDAMVFWINKVCTTYRC